MLAQQPKARKLPCDGCGFVAATQDLRAENHWDGEKFVTIRRCWRCRRRATERWGATQKKGAVCPATSASTPG